MRQHPPRDCARTRHHENFTGRTAEENTMKTQGLGRAPRGTRLPALVLHCLRAAMAYTLAE